MELFSWYRYNLSFFRNWSCSHPIAAANTSFPMAFRGASGPPPLSPTSSRRSGIGTFRTATRLAIKIPPSTAPYFVVQYRTLTHCRWQLGADSYDHKNYGHVLTQTQSGTFAIRPRGPLGVITVRLKPEGAARLARASMHELINVKIGLRNIFKDHDIALLEERVMESGSSSERIACVES